MTVPQSSLFKDKTFLPLFVTQWFGAFNDNALKSAFSFLIAFKGMALAGVSADLALMVGATVYILPFLLFSGIAGELSDRFDKARIVRVTRLAEIPLALIAGVALYLASAPLMLICLFAYSTQSAFFGPAKYSILPQMLEKDQLVDANALFESSTFVAILLGLVVGGYLSGNDQPGALIALLSCFAVASYLVSRKLPTIPPVGLQSGITGSLNPWTTSVNAVKQIRENGRLTRSAMGIAWFWAIGLVVISILPNIARDQLGVSADTANALIGSFVVGIGLGTFLISRFLKGEISARHVPLGALGMAIFLIDLSYSLEGFSSASAGSAIGPLAFVSSWEGARVVIDMVAIAAFGGVFTVPLYAILQTSANHDARSRTIAGSNIINAGIMVLITVLVTFALGAGISFAALLTFFGFVNIGVAIYVVGLVPDEVVKSLTAMLVKALFGARVENLEAYGNGRDRAVVIANHTSFLDAVLLGCLLPGRPAFAINSHIARRWWIKPAFLFFDLIPVDPTSPYTVRKMVRIVKDEGRRLIIFPEGRITVTGALMKIYDGPAMIAAKAEAPLIPIRIEGAQFSKFSRLGGKLPLRWFPKIKLTILPQQSIDVSENLIGRAKRSAAAVSLHNVMTQMVFDTSPTEATLFEALIDAARTYGKSAVVEDIERNPIGYRRILIGAFAIGGKLAPLSRRGDRLGLLLPNSTAAVVTFFACQAIGRIPAMLNFTAGKAGVEAALKAANIKTVVTSRRFVERGKLEALIEVIEQSATVIYLEDVRDDIRAGAKIGAALKAWFPRLGFRLSGGAASKPDDEAVTLFTSGSEGLPKGVALSHRNIQANRYQVTSVIDFSTNDVVLNALPMFHSFGLTAGTLLPVLSGVKIFLYPSPLHYRIVPEIAYDTNATILFGTDTFLSGYARMANGYDFYSLRYVFAGAERVRPETRKNWNEKFGLRILEGYGTTETAPVLAINTPMANKPGSAGRLLPGMRARLEEIPGFEDGGRLHVSGPNVMLGYLKVENPDVIEPPLDGWHDTGDIVTMDDRGFIAINGRAKRFAKIGGEMVSLAAVEALAGEVWPEVPTCAIALPHEKKGEQVILLSLSESTDAKTLSKFAKSKGVAEIMVPKTVIIVDAIPLLGTGKVDLAGAKKLGETLMARDG